MNTTTKPDVIITGDLTDEQLDLRKFLMGAIIRSQISIENKVYRFCDDWILNNDNDIASKANADTLIKEAYETFK